MERQRRPRALSETARLSPRRVYDRGFRFRWTPPSKQERTAVGAIAPQVTFWLANVTVLLRSDSPCCAVKRAIGY